MKGTRQVLETLREAGHCVLLARTNEHSIRCGVHGLYFYGPEARQAARMLDKLKEAGEDLGGMVLEFLAHGDVDHVDISSVEEGVKKVRGLSRTSITLYDRAKDRDRRVKALQAKGQI